MFLFDITFMFLTWKLVFGFIVYRDSFGGENPALQLVTLYLKQFESSEVCGPYRDHSVVLVDV